MNSTPASQQLRVYFLNPAHTVNFVFVLLGGYATRLFIWEIGRRQELTGYVLENQLPSGDYPGLVALVGAAFIAAALWVGGALIVARLTHHPLDVVLTRMSGVFLGATLLVFLPVLSLEGIESARQLLTLALITLMGAITAVAVATMRRGKTGSKMQAVSGNFVALQQDLAPFTRRRAWFGDLIVVVLVFGYMVTMSALTVARYDSFLTHAFDLGIQNQAMATLVTKGLPIVTQYGSEPVNQFGDHFSPIYYLLLPFSAAASSAKTLLILQSVALGLGAVPVYLLARAKIGSTTLAVSFAAAYLLYPALHAVNTFDFHEIALATPLLLFSLYFLETKRRGLFLVFLVLAALTKEEVALSAAAIGLYVLLVKRDYRLGGGVITASLVYFVLVTQGIMPALGGGPDLGRFAGIASSGQTGFTAILLGMLSNPIYTFSQVFLNGQKMLFLVQLLLPVLFLPLLAGSAWLMAVPAFAVALLASVPSQYSLDYHYPAIMVPFVFVLAILALQRLNLRRRPFGSIPDVRSGQQNEWWSYDEWALAAAILVVSLALNYTYGWIGGKRAGEFPRTTDHNAVVAHIIDEIPRQASVSTLSDLVPHLSNRERVYLFPIVNDADFLVFDSDPTANFWPYVSSDARGESIRSVVPYLVSGQYGLVRSEDGVLLLQKGHEVSRNQEALRILLSATYEAEDQRGDMPSQDLPDDQAREGKARVGTPEMRAQSDKEGLIFGPYVTLPQGKYQVVYRLKREDDDELGLVATLDVFSNSAGGPLAGIDVAASDFRTPGSYQEFVVDLETQSQYDDVEFRVLYTGKGTLWVDNVTVVPLKVKLADSEYTFDFEN